MEKSVEIEGWWDTETAATYFGVKPNTVSGWVRRGWLPSVQVQQRRHRFDPDLLSRFVIPLQGKNLHLWSEQQHFRNQLAGAPCWHDCRRCRRQ